MAQVVIDGRGSAKNTRYTITVSGGEISRVAGEETMLGVPVTGNATGSAGKSSTSGWVGQGADGYEFDGTLENVELTNPAGAEVVTDSGPSLPDGGAGGVAALVFLLVAGVAYVLFG